VHNLLDTALWGDQALGRDIAGDEDSVNSISREAILQFWKQHYNRNNMVISVAGNVTNERAALAIEAAFAELSDGATSQYIPSLPPQPGPNMVLQHDDSEQSNFCLGFSAISQDDPDRRALMVFDTIMGGSMSSRLFQEIREERGLAYNVGSYSREDHDTGKWLVYGSVEPSKLEECIATIMAELRRVLSEGITPEELQQVKEQVKGGVLLSLEDTWSVAARNGSQQLRYDTVIPVEQVVAEVEAVTQEDVQRVARRVLHENTLHLAVIGPHDDEEAATLRALLTLGA
jgi:predicted Zn-dependent peptidase